jgi:hypothetical protein
MSRMNAAWSNEPPWAEAVPAIFKEPMTIAFGGAILAHAIFFLGLPVVAGSEKQPDVQPVATTVLTDQERAAVPADLAQSQFSAGGLLPGTNSGLTIPPIPSGTTSPQTNFGNLPGAGLTFDPPSYTYTPPANDNSAQLAETKRQQQEADRKANELIAAKKDAADQKLRDQTSPTNGIKPQVAPTEADLRQQSQMPPGTPAGEPPKQPEAQTPINQPQVQPTRLSNAEIIAKAPAGTYDFKPELTGPKFGSPQAQGTAITAWAAKPDSEELKIYNNQGPTLKDKFTSLPIDPDPNIKTLRYPPEINGQTVAVIDDYAQKVKEGYGTAIVGMAIDGKGEFVTEPTIIQSTGYKILDAYAIAYVKKPGKKRMFPPTPGRSKLYYMIVPIDPPVNKPTA